MGILWWDYTLRTFPFGRRLRIQRTCFYWNGNLRRRRLYFCWFLFLQWRCIAGQVLHLLCLFFTLALVWLFSILFTCTFGFGLLRFWLTDLSCRLRSLRWLCRWISIRLLSFSWLWSRLLCIWFWCFNISSLFCRALLALLIWFLGFLFCFFLFVFLLFLIFFAFAFLFFWFLATIWIITLFVSKLDFPFTIFLLLFWRLLLHRGGRRAVVWCYLWRWCRSRRWRLDHDRSIELLLIYILFHFFHFWWNQVF